VLINNPLIIWQAHLALLVLFVMPYGLKMPVAHQIDTAALYGRCTDHCSPMMVYTIPYGIYIVSDDIYIYIYVTLYKLLYAYSFHLAGTHLHNAHCGGTIPT
jgi:hypothetical protein